MKLRTKVGIIFLNLLFSNIAFAQIDCKAPSQVWMELTCKYDVEDTKLKSLINNLNLTLDKKNLKDAKIALNNSQKGWEVYRENTCNLVRESVKNKTATNSNSNGLSDLIMSGEEINNRGLKCFLDMTKERVSTLNLFVKSFK
jgi:uncharacterized protein YecT (DUF1311 family)